MAEDSVGQNEAPTLVEILGDRAPLVANARVALGSYAHGTLAYGNLGWHFDVRNLTVSVIQYIN